MTSLVNKLPPEIVSYIARFAFLDDDVDTRSIVPFTHVCRYWRDSIISTPENWTLISTKRRNLAALSLARAKAAPLTFRLNLQILKSDPGFLDLLLPRTQNTTSLSVIGFSTVEELTQALPNFPRSMPNLRSLTLGRSRKVERSPVNDPFDFSAHTLRDLSLENIPLFPSILDLKTLTRLSPLDHNFNLHLDTLLSFLEENHSLESADLEITFAEASLRHSQRKTPIGNRFGHLSISSNDGMDSRALISSIGLRKGANLKIEHRYRGAGLPDILSGVSLDHLPSLSSPSFMEYQTSPRTIRLLGPEGIFLYEGCFSQGPGNVFREFTVLPVAGIREFRFKCRGSRARTELHLSSLPSLEVLVVEADIHGPTTPPVFPDPTSPSCLKTLVFVNCGFDEAFLAELTQFACERKNTTSTSLHRVVIIDTYRPTADSIMRLREHVPVVEVMEGWELPEDLSWGESSGVVNGVR